MLFLWPKAEKKSVVVSSSCVKWADYVVTIAGPWGYSKSQSDPVRLCDTCQYCIVVRKNQHINYRNTFSHLHPYDDIDEIAISNTSHSFASSAHCTFAPFYSHKTYPCQWTDSQLLIKSHICVWQTAFLRGGQARREGPSPQILIELSLVRGASCAS